MTRLISFLLLLPALALGETTVHPVLVKSPSVRCNGVADDTAALQAAVNVAATSFGEVVLPPGNCKVTAPITFSQIQRVTVRGSGVLGTTITAGAAMAAMFDIESNPGNPPLFFGFRDLTLDGAGLADVGIKAPTIAHSLFYRVRVKGTLTRAMWLGYGWNNDVVECEIANNSGTGLYGDPAGGLNNFVVDKTKIYSNAGWGIHVAGNSTAFHITSSTIELNRKGGILFERSGLATRIAGSYIEGNAQDGHAFTTPAVTIKAEIVFSGDSSTALGKGFPSAPVTIEDNYFISPYADASVYAGGAVNLRFSGNHQSTTNKPAISYWGSADYANASRTVYENNYGFADTAPAGGAVAMFVGGYPSGGNPAAGFESWSNPWVLGRNYFPADLFQHGIVFDNSAGSWIRSSQSYNGFPVYEITGADNNSSAWGVTVQIAEHPELANRLMYAAAWVKASTGAGTVGGRIFSSAHSGGSGASYFAATTWRLMTLYFTAPGSGSFTIGFQKIAAAGTAAQSVYIAKPVVALVGAPYESFWRDPAPPRVEWHGSAAPTAGTWAQGDRVWNTAPAAAGPLGWACTTGGTPGTWKAMANLAP